MNRASPRIRPGVVLAAVGIALLVTLLMIRAGHFHDYGASTAPHPIVDFDAFHVAGQLALGGRFDEAYRAVTMEAALRTLGHGDKLMPWTYPPVFGLVVAPLARLPLGLSYLLFCGLTLAAYLLVLWRLAGAQFGLVLIATLPAAILNIACGQNGFLTGALAGLAALGALEGRGGAALGLMVIKPHLAAALGIEALLSRRWRQASLAVITGLASCLLATAVFGAGIWPAFLAGVAEARDFLASGRYPLHRMVSTYAALASLGLPAKVAFAGQALMAGLLVAALWRAVQRGVDRRIALGLAALIAPFLSPYLYDYDLTLTGVALALLLPALGAHLSRPECGLALALGFVLSGYGLVQAVGLGVASSAAGVISPGGLIAPLMIALLVRAALRSAPPASSFPLSPVAGPVTA